MVDAVMEAVRAQTDVALSPEEAGYYLHQASYDVGSAVDAAPTAILREEEREAQAMWSDLDWRRYEV